MKFNLACWKAIVCSPPYFPTKKSSKSLTLALPISSLDVEFGTTSITPHYITRNKHVVDEEELNQRDPYSRRGRSDPVREKIQRQPNTLEDVLEHCDKLEGQHVLSTIVSDFEDSLLPNIVLGACFVSFSLSNCVRIDIDGRLRLANFERRHEWGLSNHLFKTRTPIAQGEVESPWHGSVMGAQISYRCR
jgi:hypothetical protein